MNPELSKFLPDLSAILPEVVIAVMACAVLLIDVFQRKENGKNIAANLTIASLAAAGLAIVPNLFSHHDVYTFAGMFVQDGFSNFCKLIFVLSGILVVLLAEKNLGINEVDEGEFYCLLLFSTLGEMILVSSNDLMMLFLGMELMSLAIYCLAGYTRYDERSNESAVKYFILGAVSTCIMVYGMSLLYGITGATTLRTIPELVANGVQTVGIANFFENGGSYGHGVLLFAIVMTVSGFAFKIAAAPFHMWTPDVYEGAPTSVTAFMSIGPKIAGVAALGRFLLFGLPSVAGDWMTLLAALAFLSMTIGNLAALLQTSLKRMLAYSSVAHAGYLLVGLAGMAGESMAHGKTESYGLFAILFYAFTYVFMNIGAFGMIVLQEREGHRAEDISDLNGLSVTNPGLAVAMMIFMFSLAGIPPAVGFVGKLFIFTAAINADLKWLAVAGVLNSAVSAYFYLKVVVAMYFREPSPDREISYANRKVGFAVAACAVLSLSLIVFPGPILTLAKESVAHMLH